MKAATLGGALALVLTAATANAQAPSWTVPPESQRCPSKWGAGDERGAANHDEAADRAQRRQADQDRRGDRARPRARRQHAVLRHAPLRRARQAHVHEHRLQQARQQRGDGALRDRPGRHAVRRLRAPEPWQQPLQLLQDRRDREPRRLHQARHPQRRRAYHARRADRRRRLQGRRDARRQLRDHGGRPRRRAEEAEHDAPAGRRGASSTPAGASCGARTMRAT